MKAFWVWWQIWFFFNVKGRCHSNRFCFLLDLFARSQCNSGSAVPMFTIIAPYGRYWIADDQSRLFFRSFSTFYIFRYLKGRCHDNQLKLKNWHFLRTSLLCRAAIWKGIEISQFRFQKITQNEYFYIVYNFGGIQSRNLRVYAVNNSTFCGDMAKITSCQISQNVLDLPWSTLQVW